MKITTLPHNIAAPITLPEGSLTRVYFESRNLSARLTDDEICENSTTTLIIEGGNAPYTVTCTDLSFSTTSNPNVFNVTNLNSLSSTLSVLINVDCSGCTPIIIPITIHEKFASDLIILVDGIPATSNQNIPSCPGTPITLEAQFTKSTAGTYSTSGDYHFLWAPDTGITSNTCSTQLPMCPEIEVDPERPTKYTVYVTDDFCWQSASVIIKPLIEMDLGIDQTICNGTTIEVVPTYVVHQGGFSYNLTWTPGNTNGLTYTYNPTVAGDQIITAELVRTGSPPYCVITDQINIKSLNCCSGVFSLIPTLQNGTYASYSEDLVNAVDDDNIGDCPACIQVVNSDGTSNYNLTKNQTKVTIDLLGHANTYTINGNFIVDNDIMDQNNDLLIDGYDLTIKNGNLTFGSEAQILVGDKRKLVLENCTLTNCTSEMWNGVNVSKTGVELPPSIEFINCVFSGATKAINLARESNFKIEDCTFENNYVDIHLEKYQQPLEQDELSGVSTNNYIRGCTFTSDGNTLLSPYSSVHKFAGISLDDVRYVVLGDSDLTVDYNTFDNSNYGIYSYNSSFDCYHSTFSDITNFGGLHWVDLLKAYAFIRNLIVILMIEA
ncbi:MAG: right-handed parallel beta-helix repeat-containing protein [Bacteroidetes bacterium]|nr:right-handed parallel beta-helix repeat-containing protein [Bacteroidota bacterium]